MNAKQETRGNRVTVCLAMMLTSMLAYPANSASANGGLIAPHCTDVYEPSITYPPLPWGGGPDVSGEAGVSIFLHVDRAVVEVDGCFYTLDRGLVIDLVTLDFVTLVLELPEHPDGASVYVTRDGAWVETLDVSGPTFEYIMDPTSGLGFEIAQPGQTAPTGPVVVSQPTGGNPRPK